MDERALEKLLTDVRDGRTRVDQAVGRLKDLPFAELGYATLDTHRALRFGFPEVVLGGPKTVEQLLGIVAALKARGQSVLVTRLAPEQGEALVREFPQGRHHTVARLFHLELHAPPPAGEVAVVTAGTSDIPVAEEAALTCEAMGARVRRIFDVGVAGIHRLLRRREDIQAADVAVVVAGMEGALASAVGGLVGIPVVAVPTSVGYGASLGGVAALLSMVNSCAANVAVVNIDNGFGGGFYATLVSRSRAGVARGASAQQAPEPAEAEARTPRRKAAAPRGPKVKEARGGSARRSAPKRRTGRRPAP